MTELRIVNRTRGTVVGSHVTLADTPWGRLRGYLGRRRPKGGEGLLLAPCSGIHMWGMRFPLDVLFLDREGKVLSSEPDLRPWQGPRRVNDAHYVLEIPVGTIEATGTRQGDRLVWMPPQGTASAPGGNGAEARDNGSGSGTSTAAKTE